VLCPKESLLLGVVSIPCYEDIMDHSCPSFIPRWLQGDCRENVSEQRQIQNVGQIPCFSLTLS
jgi:hypothetical protein